MKKVLVFCLVLVMALSVSITAFAAGAFVSSPSRNDAPTLVGGKNESENCSAGLSINSYSDRNKLSDQDKKDIEQAYKDIATTDDLTKLNSDLSNLASQKNVKGTNLSVSDLFNVDYSNCDSHDGHGKFSIQLSADTLDNFFALMRFDGKDWHLVKDAKVENGNLVFTSEELGSFAVVVDATAPKTGNAVNIYLIVTVALGIALTVVLVSLKKKPTV